MYTLNDGNVFIAVVVVVVVVIVARSTQCVRATSKNKQYKIIITAVFFLRNYGNLLLVNAELKRSVYIYSRAQYAHTNIITKKMNKIFEKQEEEKTTKLNTMSIAFTIKVNELKAWLHTI